MAFCFAFHWLRTWVKLRLITLAVTVMHWETRISGILSRVITAEVTEVRIYRIKATDINAFGRFFELLVDYLSFVLHVTVWFHVDQLYWLIGISKRGHLLSLLKARTDHTHFRSTISECPIKDWAFFTGETPVIAACMLACGWGVNIKTKSARGGTFECQGALSLY